MTRELPSADRRVKPADLAVDPPFSNLLQLTAIPMQAHRGSDPRVGK